MRKARTKGWACRQHRSFLMTLLTSGRSMRTSAFSFSAFNSSSTFRSSTLGFTNFLGCCSNPAYENVFLNATPSTRRESYRKEKRLETRQRVIKNLPTVTDPPVTFLIPIMDLSSVVASSIKTASTTIYENCAQKHILYQRINHPTFYLGENATIPRNKLRIQRRLGAPLQQ